MEQIFQKLVRDFIPDIIEKNGEIPITRILEDDEYKKALFQKLKEEVEEVCSASTTDDVLEEVADVYEVLLAIVELHNHSMDDVFEIAQKKKIKRGGFQKRVFLEKTLDSKL